MRSSVALALLVVACGAFPVAPVPKPVPSAAASTSAPHVVEPAVRTTRDHIEAFAQVRGGLHGTPVRMPYRRYDLKGAECWLLFVGGELSAQAAWLATPWHEAWGKPRAGVPGVSAGTQAGLLEDGVVFERVAEWPRAVRVEATTPTQEGVIVTLESLAARDQPAGIRGAVLVTDDIGAGSLPTAKRSWQYHPGVLLGSSTPLDAATQPAPHVVEDAEVKKAAAVVKRGLVDRATVFEAWQSVFFRKLDAPDPKRVKAALAAAVQSGCIFDGTCLLDTPDVHGAIVARDEKSFRIVAVVVRPLPVTISPEPRPVSISSDDLQGLFRREETPSGDLRPVASAAVGDAHLHVAFDDRDVYLVESQGPFLDVATLVFRPEDKVSVEARFEDVDGDGLSDILIFVRWPKAADADTYDAHSLSLVVFRSAEIGREPTGRLEREIDVAGARDLDDLARRAHAPISGAVISSQEACAILTRSSTPRGLLANATADARIISFDEPMDPVHATRVVPAAHATAADVAPLKNACSDPSEGGFTCRDGLCGNLDYGLGSLYRFVREGRAVKLESALIYVGS